MTQPVTLAHVNALDATAFEDCFGDIAEYSPWVARIAARLRPFGSRSSMHGAFVSAIQQAEANLQLDLINAHPDLAGKAMIADELTEESKSEQSGAGLDRLSTEEFARFTALNEAYKTKFGFPFIYAVKGSDKTMILDAFEERLKNDRDAEFAQAIKQVSNIVRFRLEERVCDD